MSKQDEFALLFKCRHFTKVGYDDQSSAISLVSRGWLNLTYNFQDGEHYAWPTELGWECLVAHMGWDALDRKLRILVKYQIARAIDPSDKPWIAGLVSKKWLSLEIHLDEFKVAAVTTDTGREEVRKYLLKIKADPPLAVLVVLGDGLVECVT